MKNEDLLAGYMLDPVTGHYRPRPPPPPAGTPTKADAKAERQLQAEAENWLTLRGYLRLTAHNAQRLAELPDTICRGWFGVQKESQRNAFLPDLMIYSPDMRRCLPLELKTASVYQDGQREMIDGGRWIEARTLEQVALRVREWEASNRQK